MKAKLALVPEQRLSKSLSPRMRLKHLHPGNQPFKILPPAADYTKPRELPRATPETVARIEAIATKIVAVQMWHAAHVSALS